MKKQFLLLITVFYAWISQAQIPNAGFETWVDISLPGASIKDPQGWTTANLMLSFSGVEEAAVLPSTDAYLGTYAMQLRNVENMENMTAYASSMKLDGMDFIDKFPVQGKPTALRGFHKYSYLDKDTFTVSVILFKNGEVIGSGDMRSDSQVTTYSPFRVPIEYYQGNENKTPDSATIYISVGMSGREQLNKTVTLLVDELSFEGITTGNDDELTKQLQQTEVYPVPASDELTVAFKQSKRGTKTFRVFSVLGAEVTALTTTREYGPGNHRIQIPMGVLSPGIYWLQVSESNSVHTIRISVQ